MKLVFECYLLACATITFTVVVGIEENSDVLAVIASHISSKSNSPPTPKCFPNITTNTGVILNSTILSPQLFPCANNISTVLKQIFSENASKERHLMTDAVGSLCSAFVDLTSQVIFNGKSLLVCSQNVLGNESVERRDFCKDIQTIQENIKDAIQEGLKSANVHLVAKFKSLMGMDSVMCLEVCGKVNSRALCNAYYAMARFWTLNVPKVNSDRSQSEEGGINRVEEKVEKTGSNVHTNVAVPVSNIDTTETSDPFYLEPSKNQSKIVAKLARLILSMPEKNLRLMSQDMVEAIKEGMLEVLPRDVVGDVVKLSEESDILKMFWVFKVAPPRLGTLRLDDWKFIGKDLVNNFFHMVPFSSDVVKDVRELPGIEQVVRCIFWYRNILFREDSVDANQPSPYKDADLYPEDIGLESQSHVDAIKQVIGSDAHPPTEGNEAGNEEVGVDGNNINQQSLTDDENSIAANDIKQSLTDDENSIAANDIKQSLTDDENSIAANDIKQSLTNDDGHGIVPNSPSLVGPGEGVGGDSNGAATKTKYEEPIASGRSYGPYHFLSLFLFVGGVIVVGYLCMQSRKKIREGVGSYMSGKSGQRRVRDYRRLAT